MTRAHTEISMMIKRILCACALLAALTGDAVLWADDHVVWEETRTSMGSTMPPRRSEVWIAKDKVYYLNSGRVGNISRSDLGKMWTVLLGQNRYFEESMPEPSAPSQKTAAPARIQSVGFDYQPEYEWTLRDSGRTDVVNGRSCRVLTVEGEADYAREVREVCVAYGTPIDAKEYFRKMGSLGVDPSFIAFYWATPALNEGLALRMRTIAEPALGPTRSVETRILSTESTSPPDGIYDIPAGFQKADPQELFR